jgi:hypothetical protein
VARNEESTYSTHPIVLFLHAMLLDFRKVIMGQRAQHVEFIAFMEKPNPQRGFRGDFILLIHDDV